MGWITYNSLVFFKKTIEHLKKIKSFKNKMFLIFGQRRALPSKSPNESKSTVCLDGGAIGGRPLLLNPPCCSHGMIPGESSSFTIRSKMLTTGLASLNGGS